jgi:enoyl-[acyl-carrier-protein] reductase (NADH)
VAPLAQQVQAAIMAPLDVAVPGQLEALFAQIEQQWGTSISSSIPSPMRRNTTCMAA